MADEQGGSSENVQTLSDVVKVLVKCSSSDAERAADMICQDPKVLAQFSVLCGLGAFQVGYGGRLMVAGNVLAPGVTFAGAILAASGAYTARRFCGALIRQTRNSIEEGTRKILE